MKRVLWPLLAMAAMGLWVACDSQGPTEPLDLDPSFSISDQAHGGTPHFFFLPPMVSQPSFDGTFLATASPAVDICLLVWIWYNPEDHSEGGEYNCNGPSVRRFGPGEEVEVDPRGQHYMVNWDTREASPAGDPLTPPGLYRITVVVGGTPLGHADVEILEHGGGFQNLTEDDNLGEVVGLVDGRTLPIKFRIEEEITDYVELHFEIAYSALLGSDLNEPFLSDVFLLDRDFGISRNITNSSNSIDFGPSWSPDGQKIVFATNRDSPGGMDLYIMNADGSNPQPLVADGWNPAWSPGVFPDGRERIAFQRGATPGEWDPEEQTQNIWVINADGSNPHPVTDVQCFNNNLPDPFEDLGPAWRPGPFPSLSFSRNAIWEETYPGNESRPDCASWSFDAAPPNPGFPISNFDVVQVYDPYPKFLLNWTMDNSADDLGPVWSHSGQKLLFWKRTGDNPLGIDDGDLWIMFIQVEPGPDYPIVTRTPIQLTSRRGWISGASDWAPGDSEILISWGDDLFDMGLYTMVPPPYPGGPYGDPVLLIPNAFGGKYRPGLN